MNKITARAVARRAGANPEVAALWTAALWLLALAYLLAKVEVQ
ncbi:MAG: hypothetical protein P8Y53_15045 [Pseudolabrys sp.]